ncbi:hypothetical protein FE257_000721 [Aspergillus nanangensis]|uniref:Cyclase family protein n=1 Tax=Aspergillus nanangensis TaxID=2582783 RepID=A0AAD4CEM0_ASPNN|nr:hypothetical protein FE257_000721 [Aspergillus nanangensis]
MAASRRLSQLTSTLTPSSPTTMTAIQPADQLPWNPNCEQFPSRKELIPLPGAPEGAAWVWGKDDSLGRVNLLTPQRVKAAATEIQTGEMIRLDLPVDVPAVPSFDRETFQHKIKPLTPGLAYDDIYVMNTQSGTQWDGLRHVAHFKSRCFYNGVTQADIEGPSCNHRNGMHHWAQHGIAGRAVLLDYRHYATTHNIHYDPNSSHAISFADLQACGTSQGLDIRPVSQGGDIKPGDMLLVRSGFVENYHGLSAEAWRAAATRGHDDQCWAGVKQEDAMVDWLHDCYFAAVAGDSPTFECWPAVEGRGLIHQEILALWGMPLGEMFDLERLAKRCRELGKWTFFLTSAPANVPGGVGSHPNATAIL